MERDFHSSRVAALERLRRAEAVVKASETARMVPVCVCACLRGEKDCLDCGFRDTGRVMLSAQCEYYLLSPNYSQQVTK